MSANVVVPSNANSYVLTDLFVMMPYVASAYNRGIAVSGGFLSPSLDVSVLDENRDPLSQVIRWGWILGCGSAKVA